MPQDRFDHLEEGDELPNKVKEAITKLDRFGYLEVGSLTNEAVSSLPRDKILCPHCGQFSDKESKHCWACSRSFERTATAPEIAKTKEKFELVLDGVTYDFDHPNLPQDVRVLMERIQNEGYSPKLLAEWRNWRATRSSERNKEKPFERQNPKSQVQAFRDKNMTVLRIDEKLYTSKDTDLPQELKEIFLYIDQHGVTPSLMNHLRQHGTKVKFRPSTTIQPSDGDIQFWKNAQNKPEDSPLSNQPQDMMDLEMAAMKFRWQIRKILAPIIVPIMAPLVLLVLLLFVLFYLGIINKQW